MEGKVSESSGVLKLFNNSPSKTISPVTLKVGYNSKVWEHKISIFVTVRTANAQQGKVLIHSKKQMNTEQNIFKICRVGSCHLEVFKGSPKLTLLSIFHFYRLVYIMPVTDETCNDSNSSLTLFIKYIRKCVLSVVVKSTHKRNS